jgi:hypothetical protein
MLSPKKPKPGVEAAGELLPLHQYNCIVDGRPFQNVLNDVVARLGVGADESGYYRNLAKFLTECVKVCHDALDKQEGFPTRHERWYKDLEFTVGKPVVDGDEDAAFFKPDVVGGV